MNIQFKYKFILSFALVEIFFISLIVFFNFSSLNNLSKALINEKIETTTKLFSEFVKVPLITYDLATIDNGVQNLVKIKNVVAAKVVDNQNRVLSSLAQKDYNYNHLFDNNSSQAKINEREFKKFQAIISFNEKVLGSTTIIFEITDSLNIIKHNRDITYILVGFEMLLSIFIAYVIGHRLTKSLTLLTSAAQKIAVDDRATIPALPSKGDEISVLSDTLRQMQRQIVQRSHKLLKERNFYTALLNQAHSIILVMNAKGEIILSNQITKQLTGYSQEELQGRLIQDVFLPETTQDNTKITLANFSIDDFPKSDESDWRIKDGSRLSFACSHSCLLDVYGEIEYLITVAIDITEKNASNRKIRALLNSPIDSIILISTDETILEINEVAANRLGSLSKELKGKQLFDYYPQNNAPLRKTKLHQAIETKKSVMFEDFYNEKYFKTYLYPIVDKEQNVIQVSIFSYDVTVQRKAQKELQKYIELVDENVLISHTDLEGVVTSVSQAFCKLSGYTSEELIGNKYNLLRDPLTPNALYEELWNTIQSGNVWRGEIRNVTKSGDYYWVDSTIYPDYDENGMIIGYNAIRLEITSKKLLEELSITDALTKLYNRRYFDNIFDKEINRTKRDKKIFALLSLDVDNFKLYNDTYGHQMGDKVLFSVASILKQNMKRATDAAFRLGGEEFSAIYIVEDENDVYRVAETIRNDLETLHIEHTGNSASPFVTASFGVIYIDFAKNENIVAEQTTLYRRADELLYKAKASGKNIVIVDTIEDTKEL